MAKTGNFENSPLMKRLQKEEAIARVKMLQTEHEATSKKEINIKLQLENKEKSQARFQYILGILGGITLIGAFFGNQGIIIGILIFIGITFTLLTNQTMYIRRMM